jgi:ATP-binding cassette subfamily G (WHITE) protein 2
MQRFEKLMIMSAGRRVYYGSVNEYVPYLEQHLQCDIPTHASPFDLLLDALNPAIGLGDTVMRAIPESCPDVAESLANLFEESLLAKNGNAADLSLRVAQSELTSAQEGKTFAATWIAKFWTLLVRTFLIKTRDPIVLMTLISSAVMMGVIFGALYFQLYERDEAYVVLDTQMAVTMTIIMIVFLPYDVTLTFPKERSIFLRERKAGLYGTSSFYFARILCDMPLHIISAFIFGAIVWGMAGLETGFFSWIWICTIAILAGASLMQMVGSLSRNFEEANLLMMLILMLSMVMTSGFVRDVPDFLEWLRKISIMGIISDMAMYFEFSDVDPKFGTADEVIGKNAVQIRDDDDMFKSYMIVLAIFVFARTVTFLAVKFLFTGRSFWEDLLD